MCHRFLYMGFVAMGMSVSTRVGNALGAGEPERAKAAAQASLLLSPLYFAIIAAILIIPSSRVGRACS